MTDLGLLLLRATVGDAIGVAGPAGYCPDAAVLAASGRELPERMGV